MADLPVASDQGAQPVVINDPVTAANVATVTAANALKVDGSAVVQPTSAPGTVSAGNSTTTPLGSNGVFTGTFENVKDYAYIALIIFSDQASASGGLSMQWSPDGINVDRTETSNLNASAGRAFAIQVRAQYFRIVYTNGSIAQGVFRLNTTYHVTGTGLITKPVTTAVSTDNFALLTLSQVAGESGTNVLPITTTASSGKQALDVSIIPVASTIPSSTNIAALVIANAVYTVGTAINMATMGADNPILLIKNPITNTKILYIYSIILGLDVANNAADFELYANPTVTTNGTSQTPQNNNVGNSTASVMQIFTLPTVSSNGTQINEFFYGQNQNSINFLANLSIAIQPGNSILLVGNPINSNNRPATVSLTWVEQ
jgi:hypothetical protein